MAVQEHGNESISSSAIAEVIFLFILVWLIAGPLSGLVLSTQVSLSGIFAKGAHQVESTKQLAQQLIEASTRIKMLEKQLADTELDLAKYKQQAQDTDKLRQLLGLRDKLARTTVAAEVISRNPDNWFEQVTIDKGERDGIKVGSACMTAQGIVGQVTSVTENASVVRLLTDPDQKIAVLIERINQPGVLVGNHRAPPQIEFVPVGTAVDVGDKVMTLGNGGIFPAGHQVGTVSAVHRDTNGTTLSIEIKPSENFYNLRQIIVIPTEGV